MEGPLLKILRVKMEKGLKDSCTYLSVEMAHAAARAWTDTQTHTPNT